MNPTTILIFQQLLLVCILMIVNLGAAGTAYQLKTSLFIQYACSFGFIGWAGYFALLAFRLLRIVV